LKQRAHRSDVSNTIHEKMEERFVIGRELEELDEVPNDGRTLMWARIPDVIEGTAEDNDALIADWPKHIRGVPVWHMHEPVDRLVRLANEWQTVALGSSGQWATPGTSDWWVRMQEALTKICDHHGRPICRLHGLRMLNPKVFTKMPLSSADSTNAAVNCNSKQWEKAVYKPASAWQRATIIADRVESFNSAPVFEIEYPDWLK
jgi:hypothetical protein